MIIRNKKADLPRRARRHTHQRIRHGSEERAGADIGTNAVSDEVRLGLFDLTLDGTTDRLMDVPTPATTATPSAVADLRIAYMTGEYPRATDVLF